VGSGLLLCTRELACCCHCIHFIASIPLHCPSRKLRAEGRNISNILMSEAAALHPRLVAGIVCFLVLMSNVLLSACLCVSPSASTNIYPRYAQSR
jgi:hypothetical protein